MCIPYELYRKLDFTMTRWSSENGLNYTIAYNQWLHKITTALVHELGYKNVLSEPAQRRVRGGHTTNLRSRSKLLMVYDFAVYIIHFMQRNQRNILTHNNIPWYALILKYLHGINGQKCFNKTAVLIWNDPFYASSVLGI